MGYRTIWRIRWVLVFAAAAVPLFFLPGWFRDLKVAGMLRNDSIESSLSFTYTGGREVKCYQAPEGISYVFLPSYAQMGQVGVDTTAWRVDFTGGEKNITVKEGEHAICSFVEQLPYQAVFYNSMGRELGRKTVVFLKSGKLPCLYVKTQTGSMDKLNADKRYKEKASIELLDAEGNLIFSNDIKSISGRGNQTFEYEKKSYQLKLKKPVDFMGMGESDTWILLCNVYDPAYIRNKLTYEMALQAGMPGSAESEYIDVYFNGAYAGMYQLCEKVQIGENRIEIADLEKQNRALNGKELDYADVFVSEDGMQKGTVLARSPEDITGGYLIEHDYGHKYDEEISGFITELGERYVLKNPQHASKEEVEYIGGRMQEIEDAIQAEDGFHPVTGKHYTEYLDLESWADKYLVEEITRNNGGGATSSFFYKPQDAISAKIYGGPVWDYDKGYGNARGYNKNTRDLGLLTLHMAYTRWFYYLYQQEDFVEMVKEEYRKKFSDYLEEMADRKVDEYLAQIEASAVLDRARFSHVYLTFGEDALDYKAQAEMVRQFIRERKAFLDEVWLEDARICKVEFIGEELEDGTPDTSRSGRCFMVKAGECIQELPEESREGRTFLGWRIGSAQEMLTTGTPVMEDMTVYAVWE